MWSGATSMEIFSISLNLSAAGHIVRHVTAVYNGPTQDGLVDGPQTCSRPMPSWFQCGQ